MTRAFVLLVTAAVLLGCGRPGNTPLSYDPPGSTITTSKPIERQHRRTITAQGLSLSNAYAGARANDFYALNDTLWEVALSPENAPINNSAWFGFKLWSEAPQSAWLRLTYTDGNHRYIPKLSDSGEFWTPVEAGDYRPDSTSALLRLDVGPDTVWVSAQERITSAHFARWVDAMAALDMVSESMVGTSAEGRPIRALEIGQGTDDHVLIISRQHPPEVTGTLAVLSFVERLVLPDSLASSFLARFKVLVVPVVNPDGVDQGHWRHNTGGVDLNRDWLEFNQPETRAVSEYFVERVGDGRVLFAADFHSTQDDVFYTVSRDLPANLPTLIDDWLGDIATALPGYPVNDDPSGVDSPVSKAWFYKTFKTTSLTYEVGDEQDRDRIRQVSTTGAESMMRRLLAATTD